MSDSISLNGATPAPLRNLTTLVPADGKSAERWPNVWACLIPHWCDGKCTRQAGSLRLRITGSWFVVTLCCPTEGVETDLTTDSLHDLLGQLEKHLASGKAVFRPDWTNTKKARHAKVK